MKNLAKIVAIMAFQGIVCQKVLAGLFDESHPWDRYIYQIRKKHNFALTLGSAKGEWAVKRFGNLGEETYRSQAYVLKIQYTFHIHMLNKMGYFLGSSVGVYYESSRYDDFAPSSSLHLPGLVLGLVYQFNPALRVMLAIDSYLERIDGMKDYSDSNRPISLDATKQTLVDGMIMCDYFFELKFAVRGEWHMRNSFYNGLSKPNNDLLIERAKFSKQDSWVALGFVYHYL